MELKVNHLSKSFGALHVLEQVTLSLRSGRIYCLMGPSGSGKTTFFRILLGLEQADSGSLAGMEGIRTSAVFQENRLCESFTPVDNIAMVIPGRSSRSRIQAREELLRLLPEESLSRPVSTLSGGMKRRVAIVRALSVPSDMILMDEPFTGLDEHTKMNVIRYIRDKTNDKLVIISTHQEEDVALLNGTLVTL
ncbi:ATP-binding cassette domain-containing protein [Lacrimispora saccharolytica]|uniref:ABC transporter related protein n=1 Tax=Lacrimispora saccharolytica (strain ATCC 35040 / DSM 2544 / NRCC 2533 / WM1) TaxID=610130 RepID=D9R9I3_LACSW|nr:ATP-binding cassette domain-containing protein [Lacrimispora saccharolytica]ADL05934.1 ABC transporter related protein [[Clostridium] saccharolyticum WM1]QRV19931.1 ABC transporter ATP-binding protein [Lacrimispora saccharolytica]